MWLGDEALLFNAIHPLGNRLLPHGCSVWKSGFIFIFLGPSGTQARRGGGHHQARPSMFQGGLPPDLKTVGCPGDQWLRLCLPMQGTWFDSWSRKITHATGQLSSCTTTPGAAPEAYALKQEKSTQREACALQLESSPCSLQLQKACIQQWRLSAAKKKQNRTKPYT